MRAMSIAEAWPAPGRPFTAAELDRMADDGRRYELTALMGVTGRPYPVEIVSTQPVAGLPRS